MKQKSTLKKITGSREFLLAVILILLFAIVTAISPSFLKPKSLMDMLKNNAVTMVMALGMLCVMLVGGIDISIMSTSGTFRNVHWYASEIRSYYQHHSWLL